MLKFLRAAPAIPLPFPFGETRQGGVPWRADVRESVASTAWRRGRRATMAREVMAQGIARGMLYLTEMKGQTVRAIDVSSVLNPAA